jgi:hypothetical protein
MVICFVWEFPSWGWVSGSREEDVSEVLVCYSLGVYETQSNSQANRVIA